MWYLRVYKSAKPWKYPKVVQGYSEELLVATDFPKAIQNQSRMDVVDLTDGRVLRHDYKKPLPEWLKDPLIRQMVAATGKLPEEFSKVAKGWKPQASEKDKV